MAFQVARKIETLMDFGEVVKVKKKKNCIFVITASAPRKSPPIWFDIGGLRRYIERIVNSYGLSLWGVVVKEYELCHVVYKLYAHSFHAL